MIKEFAVDPSYYSTRLEWQLIFEHFGFHKGRMISKFPKDWKKLAYKNLMDNYRRNRIKEIERLALEEKLNNFDKYFIDLKRSYDLTLNWYENVKKENNRSPFYSIISRINPDCEDKILKVENLEEENKYWSVPRQVTVERNFDVIASLLSNIFKLSKKIILVDPHFHPTKEKYRKSLQSLIKIIFWDEREMIVEYHLVADPRESTSQFQNSCQNYISPFIPSGKQLKFVRWSSQHASDPNAGGERLHPRFILTDLGGVNIEWGLDEGNLGDVTTITLLEPETYKKYWELHQREVSSYSFLDEIIISSGL